METVTNAASSVTNAASKLIWGENATAEEKTATNETGGVEPASGLQGKGTATQPFDKGNETPLATPLAETPATGQSHATSTTSTHGHHDLHEAHTGPHSTRLGALLDPKNESGDSIPSSKGEHTITTLPDRTRDTESTTTPSTTTPSTSAVNPPRPEHETAKTGVVGSMSQSSTTGSSGAPSSSTAATSAPEAISPGTVPTSSETPDVGKLKIDDIDGEEALRKKDPNDHSGEPMHMHGVDEVKKPTKTEERRESKLGQEGGQAHGKEELGTGEDWVKSTGLAAEGGDFDATKPGAGREADRLMEAKGVHKESPAAATSAKETSPAPASPTGKMSTKDKIKAKLHIGHKDKP